MALYEVPTADADILLDLHHLHRPRQHPPESLHHHQQQQQHIINSNNHQRRPTSASAVESNSMDKVYDGSTGSFNGSANNSNDKTAAAAAAASASSSLPRHGHSLSLGQLHHVHHAGSSNPNSYSHARSYSTNDSASLLNSLSSSNMHHLDSPYTSAAAGSSSAGGDSDPTSRTQTISPMIGGHNTANSTTSFHDGQQQQHHHQQQQHRTNTSHGHASSSSLGAMPQQQHYSAGLGLAGMPSPAPSAAGAIYNHHHAAAGSSSSPYSIHAAIPHHPEALQYHHPHMHGTITPPSPSSTTAAHASSLRHSLTSDNGSSSLPYTPQSYSSQASSLPSSYYTLAGTSKHSYDPAHSLPSMLPSHHQHQHPHHSHSQSLSQTTGYAPPAPPYPLSHSAQGYMTIYTVSPMYGSKDSQVSLEVGIAPHEPHYIRGFRVLFGSHGTTTRVVGESRTPYGEERVELAAVTPPIHLTNRIPANGSTCQLSLQALDESGQVADWADLGVFEFTDVTSPLKGHKRPGSPLSSIRDSPSSSMRPIFPDQSPYGSPHKRGHSRGSSIGSLVNGFGYMSHQSSHSRNSSSASNLGEYDMQFHQSPQTQGLSLSDKSMNAPGSTSGTIVGHSGHQGASSSTVWYSTPEGELIERKPIARLRAPVQPPSSTPASSNLRHPPMEPATENTPTLYRTSQLPTTGPDGTSNVATKAQLKFESDLNNMALGWSHEEWHAKRRLVHFTRKQEGGIITSSFKPISLQEITPNTIVISCIFREDKNECYVTSVDTIYLLEALVSVRFTVEEKNRIRRNLEGYKPLTITKAKSDCENFFKVIMSFTNPKPRNIEKDVKVFPWKILSNALKKIISKYSASFLKPEEMVGPGKLPPQPIGWPPGRSPPPPPASSLPLNIAGTSSSSSPGKHYATLSSSAPTTSSASGSWMPPPQAPGTSGSTTSSVNMSPMLRNDMKAFGPPLTSNGGHHRSSTLGSVAEDEPMSASINGGNLHRADQEFADDTITPGYTSSSLQHQQSQYDIPDGNTDSETPHAYDTSNSGGADTEHNPFRFT